MSKEVTALVRDLNKIAGVETREGGKHILVMRNGKFACTLSRSPSDRNWRASAIRQLERCGIHLPSADTKKEKSEVQKGIAVSKADALRKKVEQAYVELGGRDQRGVRTEFARYVYEEVSEKTLGGNRFATRESAYQTIHSLVEKKKTITPWAAELIGRAADALIAKPVVPATVPVKWEQTSSTATTSTPVVTLTVAAPEDELAALRKQVQGVVKVTMKATGAKASKARPFGVGTLGFLAALWQQEAHAAGRTLYKEEKLSLDACRHRIASFARGDRNPNRFIQDDLRFLVTTFNRLRRQHGDDLFSIDYQWEGKVRTKREEPQAAPQPQVVAAVPVPVTRTQGVETLCNELTAELLDGVLAKSNGHIDRMQLEKVLSLVSRVRQLA